MFTLAAAMSLLLCVATVVIFDDQERPLTDEDFAAVFPAVQQMDPMVLLLRGHHTISDASVPLFNQLRAVEHLDVSFTAPASDSRKCSIGCRDAE